MPGAEERAWSLGLDLGTTWTAAAAVSSAGSAEIVSLGTHGPGLPTVVLALTDGTTLSGEAAVARAIFEPERVARHFKRRVGDPTPLILGGQPWSVGALLAVVLRDVLGRATELERTAPAAVGLTHPATWAAHKIDVLRGAAAAAGIPSPFLLAEPVAAAQFYASQGRIATGEVVAVFDLGGGTFDATVVRSLGGNAFEILGTPDGVEHLGGVDVDEAVFAHVRSALGDTLDRQDPADPAVAAGLARLRDDCVRAKESLSADSQASVPVVLPGTVADIRITRSELESVITPLVRQAVTAMERAIRSSGAEPARLLLVGGSSRIPLIGQMVAGELSLHVVADAHPKHAVALGAALGAADQPAASPARNDPAPGLAAAAEPPASRTPSRAASPAAPASAPHLAPSTRSRWLWLAVVAVVLGLGVVIFLVTRPDGDENVTAGDIGITSSSASTSQQPDSSPTSETPSSAVDPPAIDFAFGAGTCPASDGSSPRTIEFADAPQQCIDPAKTYIAVFDTTAGIVRVEIDTTTAPGAANNFVVLSRYGYFDGTDLFRTDTSIGIIQGGSPHTQGNDDPGPGYTIPDEGFGDDVVLQGGQGPYRYEAGDLVYARPGGQPDSSSAQFFFCVDANCANLDSQGIYIEFGRVTEGLDVLESILATDTGGAPDPVPVVNTVTIEEA